MIPFIEKKRILINLKQCHSYVVDNNKIVSNVDDNLSCSELEEADSKIVFHVRKIQTLKQILLSDALILILG